MEFTEIPTYLEVPAPLGSIKSYFYFSEHLFADTTGNSAPHDHPDYELQYLVAGKNRNIINEREYITEAGDIILLHPNEYHYQKPFIKDELPKIFCVRFAVKAPSETATPQQKKAYESLVKLLETVSILRDTDFTLLPAFRTLDREIHEKESGYYINMQAMCSYILTGLIRLTGGMHKDIFPDENIKHVSYWRNRIEKFLHIHYAENLRLQDLADTIKLSQRQTSRLLLKEYGMNFVSKLNDIRIHHAAYQLANTDNSIHQVSINCGFSNYGYFSTCFHKKIGVPPSEYRKAKQAKPQAEQNKELSQNQEETT